MPGLDRTGPRGAGPRTGGGFGRCGQGARAGRGQWDSDAGRGWGRRGGGRGLGRGCGWGRGWGRGAWGGGPLTVEDEREMLRAEAESLSSSLEEVQARLRAISKT